ncbi:hypothetical protein GCM10011321_39290 [Youhaiella tibetensis]|uniref:Uncharacterized protein n=1 Tax=Paradevosia tibetensis TaxID=1447062 RepID=A0A5B9DRT9_9HYPH|nr:esterase-like activity of phytase family protein [Youhaiella tibetensis]QEE22141.1 hypothetical protein FNA67_19105 [Youhaiella tibetensis]GGF44876.1 hypothetical protein GCM10011321_39290 [Youhaiella tibetensis]
MTGRAALAFGLLLGLASLPVLAQSPGEPGAEGVAATATPIEHFRGAAVGERVDGLIWRGGLNLVSSTDGFGGLSSLGFIGDDGRLAMVSDRGNFVTGQLLYDDMVRPLSLVGVRIDPIQNTKGADLPRAFARDAEALDVVQRNGVPVAVRVGFENLTRVADFALTDAIPGGPAKNVEIPVWMGEIRSNKSIESLCIAPPASPVAGSTLVIIEGIERYGRNHAATLLGRADRGDLELTAAPAVNPTDCAFLPNGDLLVLERGTALLSFVMQLRLIPAAEVKPGALMEGRILLRASGGDIDNMEGVAVHKAPDGEVRITLLSDNNFNDWERNLLLEFALPE